MKPVRLVVGAISAFVLLGSAQAQILGSVSVSPASVRAGEPVTVTVNIDVMNSNYCGFAVKFGDGAEADGASDSSKPGPHTFQHIYAKPGNYGLNLVGRSVESHPNCGGDTMVTSVIVTGTAAATAAMDKPAGKMMAAMCPEKWKLVSKTSNKKTGAFMCSAKPGTALPEKNIACPGDLTYFENGKKGQLGCKP